MLGHAGSEAVNVAHVLAMARADADVGDGAPRRLRFLALLDSFPADLLV
jgi:hypothetical protein